MWGKASIAAVARGGAMSVVASVVSPDGMVGAQHRAPGSEWRTDSDFIGTAEPFELPVASGIDAGLVAV